MPTKVHLSTAILLVPGKVYKEKQWKDLEFISTFTQIVKVKNDDFIFFWKNEK
jgi:hypothetical protein